MDKLDLYSKAIALREKLGEDATSPIDIFSIINSIENLTIVFYPMSNNMSGICIKNNNLPVIAINSKMSLGRQRFSLANELYHLYYDHTSHMSVSQKNIGSNYTIEKNADCFASFFLLPENSLKRLLENTTKITLEKIIYIEQLYGLSRQALLYRLIDGQYLSSAQAEQYTRNIISSALSLGYDDTLYKPRPIDKQSNTHGYYIKKASYLYDHDLISTGKYESLLLAAFRDDLVYGALDEDELYD